MGDQRPARLLFAVAGDSRRTGAYLPVSVSRRIIDPKCPPLDFSVRDGRGESSRPRYHLRLFRSRQPALEFFTTSRGGSRDSRRSSFSVGFGAFAVTK